MDFLEACRRFIAIDSTPSHGSIEIARYAADLCQQAGLSVELQSENLNGIEQANVIARPQAIHPDQEFMLQTHLDTVDPGAYSLWDKTGANPFNASIYQNVVYGLGAADVKLDYLCKLRAIEELAHGSKWKLPPVLVGTYGEELGMSGAVRLVRKKKISPRMALVGEPTNMTLNYASKGIAHVEITIPFSQEELAYHREHNLSESTSTQSRIFRGRAAHSSTPHLGENAIVKMLRYLTQLPSGLAVMGLDGGVNFNTVPADAVLEIDMVGAIRNSISEKLSTIMRVIDELELEFILYPEEGFSPPGPTLNIGMIRTFEEEVLLAGNFRWPPLVSNEIYENWMDRLRETCVGAGAAFHIREYKEPFKANLEGALVKGCRAELTRLGLEDKCGKQSVCNEANVFSRFGIECVIIGPGVSEGNSHTPNEHVHLDQLELAVAYYKNVMQRFCL